MNKRNGWIQILAGLVAVTAMTALAGQKAGNEPVDQLNAFHQILMAEDHRNNSAPILDSALRSGDLYLQSAALQALARIQDPADVQRMKPLLASVFSAVAEKAAFAMGMIDHDDARLALRLREGMEFRASVKAQQILALGRIGKGQDLATISRNLEAMTTIVRTKAAQAMGLMLTYRLETTPADVYLTPLTHGVTSFNKDEAVAAAFALSRIKEVSEYMAASIVNAFPLIRHPEALALTVRSLAKIDNEAARAALIQSASSRSYSVRVEVMRALGRVTSSMETRQALGQGMTDVNHQVVAQSLMSLERMEEIAPRQLTSLRALASGGPSHWIQATALKALGAHDEDGFHDLLVASLSHSSPMIQEAAVSQLYRTAGTDPVAMDLIIENLEKENTRLAGAAIDGLTRLETTLVQPYIDHIAGVLRRGDEALNYYAAEFAIKHEVRELVPNLVAALEQSDVESAVALLNAIGKLGTAEQAPLIASYLDNDTKQVVAAAAAAYEALTGESMSHKIPLNSRIEDETPADAEIRWALNRRLTFVTEKGSFTMSMSNAAPLTVTKIMRLANAGFYQGKTFHRVVPNFVAQGGDPRGDGFGGPGYAMRDEVSTISHRRGTVGIATAGKDTGGCQFFINHAPNLHLDGRYTVFGFVTNGMDVVDRLDQDDVITDVIVL